MIRVAPPILRYSGASAGKGALPYLMPYGSRSSITAAISSCQHRRQYHNTTSTKSSTSTVQDFHRVLIVGAGCIGLRTALEFQQAGVAVTLRAPTPPTDSSNCSVGAGGFWMPYQCGADGRITPWALETLDELLNMHQDTKTSHLIEILPAVSLYRDHAGPSLDESEQELGLVPPDDATTMTTTTSDTTPTLPLWTRDERLAFQHVTVEMLEWQNTVLHMKLPPNLFQAGYRHAWLWKSPICDAPKLLDYYLEQLHGSSSNDIDVTTGHYYRSLAELQAMASDLSCDAIVNCTGLGARELLPDETQLESGRGAMMMLDRKTCVRLTESDNTTTTKRNDAIITVSEPPWGSDDRPAYLIPRGDQICVGGTVLKGDDHMSLRPEERVQLWQNAHNLGIDTSQYDDPTTNKDTRVQEWVGFRPLRNMVRCEFDRAVATTTNDLPVFHNYGHGGSGWTVHVGAARECVRQFLGSNAKKE